MMIDTKIPQKIVGLQIKTANQLYNVSTPRAIQLSKTKFERWVERFNMSVWKTRLLRKGHNHRRWYSLLINSNCVTDNDNSEQDQIDLKP